MVNASELKKIGGNLCLYLEIDRYRQGTFLKRNLEKALNEHEQQLKISESATADGHINGMQKQASDLQTWKYPCKEMLERLNERQRPVLRVDVRALKPCTTSPTEALSEPSHHPSKKIKILDIPCQLELKIWETQTQLVTRVRHDVQKMRIQAYQDQNGDIGFDVDMAEPFLIEVDKLFVILERGPRWKKTVAASYCIQLAIAFLDSEDAVDLLPLICKSQDLEGKLGRVTQLSAKWPNLPKCPPNGHVIRLNRALDGKRIKTNYGLEVDMGWRTSKDTPLSAYNRALRVSQAKQLPSPISDSNSPNGKGPKHYIRVTYLFRDDYGLKKLVLDGALCPMCNRRDYKSYERLHFHLLTCHDLFTFDMSKDEVVRGSATFINVTFELELADRYNDKGRSLTAAESDIAWVAPEKPFSLLKYLEGDEQWTSTKIRGKRKGAKLGILGADRAFDSFGPLPEAKAPGDVEDIPLPNRKQHPVPRAPPGIEFFRTVSKRPLEEGEMISESDDDVDEDWLKLKRKGETDASDVPESAKDFMTRLDDHFQDEQLSGDLFAGDALVRFVREHTQWLRKPSIAKEFANKIAELLSDKIITKVVHDHCLEIVSGSDMHMDDVEDDAQDTSMIHVADEIIDDARRNTPKAKGGGGLMSRKEANAILKLSPLRGAERAALKRALVQQTESPKSRSSRSLFPAAERRSSGTQDAGKSRSPSKLNGATDTPTRDEDGDVEMLEASTPVKISNGKTSIQDKPIPGHCVCGQVVDNMRTMISCANSDCFVRDYHMRCVGLSRRVPGWCCPSCAG